jgi:glycosyltransferase involved in cell wall biosynthesis
VVTCDDAGGVLEFVRDGETGFVVPPSPEAIAERIDTLSADHALCERMGRTAREMVRDRVSWDRAVAALTATLA